MDPIQRLKEVAHQDKRCDSGIRQAKREDMLQVSRVFRLARMQAQPYLPILHSPEEDLEYFTDVVFPNDQIYVSQEPVNKKIVGFIAFNHLFIDQHYLLPDRRGQGIGSALLKLAQDQSDNLRLFVFQKNHAAIRFYQKHGFHAVKETDGADNEENEPDLLMQWQKPAQTGI
jgi:ribosomal protein S18 acetylase RimI-like enzyme